MEATDVEKAVAQKSLIVWSGLYRRIKVGSEWQSFSLEDYPFLKEIYRDMSDPDVKEVSIMKATQLGITEGLLNLSFYFLDVHSENVIYLMPTASQLQSAVHSRVDPSIRNSPRIKSLFSDTSNVSVKTGNKGSMYFRGGQSEEKLFEVPAGLLIFDEYDKIPERSHELARKRLSGSQYKWVVEASNPSFPGSPIHQSYQESSQKEWTVTCGNCGTEQKVDFFGSYFNRNEQLGCRACSEDFSKDWVLSQGYWKSYHDHPKPGYQISQMLSPNVTLERMADKWREAKDSTGIKKEAFYNHRIGEPFASESSSLTKNQIKELMTGKPDNTELEGGSMGVDVGSDTLHWWVQADKTVQSVGKVGKFEELDRVIKKYGVKVVVVDIAPETRRARRFIERIEAEFDVSGWLCRRSDRLENPRIIDEENNTLKVRSVEHWDKWQEQFEGEDPLELPKSLAPEVVKALDSPVRTVEDTDRGPVARWIKGPEAHYADASCYAREGLSEGIVKNKRSARPLSDFYGPSDDDEKSWGEYEKDGVRYARKPNW